jgi:hypothetical protein
MPVSGAEHRLQNLLNGSALVSRLLPSGKGGAPDSLCSSPIVKVRSLHLNNSTSLSSIVRTITSEASSSSPIRRWRKGGADSCGNRGRLGGQGSRRAVDNRLSGRFALHRVLDPVYQQALKCKFVEQPAFCVHLRHLRIVRLVGLRL